METKLPHVTLKDLADFLKSLPDDEPINMATGFNTGECEVCLMTKYALKQGWEFYLSRLHDWINDRQFTIATLEDNPFMLFATGGIAMPNQVIAKGWKDVLKPEYK